MQLVKQIAVLASAVALWFLGNFLYSLAWQFLRERFQIEEATVTGRAVRYLRYGIPLVAPVLLILFGAYMFGWWGRDAQAPHADVVVAMPQSVTHVSTSPPLAPPIAPAPTPAQSTARLKIARKTAPATHLSESRPRIQDVLDWICPGQQLPQTSYECIKKAATEVADAARNGKLTIWIHHKGSDIALTKMPIDIWQWATLDGVIGNHVGITVSLKPQYRGLSRFPPDEALASQDEAKIAPYEDFDVMLVDDAQKVEDLWPQAKVIHVAR